MAITLINQPSEDIAIRDCLSYVFNMTGLISGSLSRRFGWRLEDDDGNVLVADSSLTPKEGVNFPVNIQLSVLRQLYTNPPNPVYFPSTYQEKGFVLSVIFKYWQIEHNNDTCNTISAVPTILDAINVYNTAISNLSWKGNLLLSTKARMLNVCRDFKDTVTFYHQGGSDSLSIQVFFKDGSSVWHTQTTASLVNTLSSGIKNVYPNSIPANVDYFKCSMGGMFWYYNLVCCSNPILLYFQTRRGGYSAITMNIDKERMKSSQDAVQRSSENCIPDNSYDGGLNIANKESYKFYELSYVIEEDDVFFEELLSSGSYFIDDGTNLFRFVPTLTDTVYKEDEKETTIVIKGRISLLITLPSYTI